MALPKRNTEVTFSTQGDSSFVQGGPTPSTQGRLTSFMWRGPTFPELSSEVCPGHHESDWDSSDSHHSREGMEWKTTSSWGHVHPWVSAGHCASLRGPHREVKQWFPWPSCFWFPNPYFYFYFFCVCAQATLRFSHVPEPQQRGQNTAGADGHSETGRVASTHAQAAGHFSLRCLCSAWNPFRLQLEWHGGPGGGIKGQKLSPAVLSSLGYGFCAEPGRAAWYSREGDATPHLGSL